MNEKQKINAERNELNILIDKGVNIEVERTMRVLIGRKYGLLKRYETITEKLKFTIKEPTLSTLDRLSSEQIELIIDESKIKENGLSEAKMLTNQQSHRMARIVAIAVLGQEYLITIQEGSRIRYEHDDKQLDELTDLFFINVKPSTLLQYTILINSMSNLGDFTNSIRLMSAVRTTMPIRIEEDKQA